MLHGVALCREVRLRGYTHGYGRKYLLERQEKDILAMG